MDALQQLILETVAIRYTYDTEFYKMHNFSVSRWNDFKTGKSSINNMKYERVNSMLEMLFSHFELDLFAKARFESNTQQTDKSAIERYHELKLEELAKLDGEFEASETSSPIYGGSNTRAYLFVKAATCEYIKMSFDVDVAKMSSSEHNNLWVIENVLM
ncbi:hypothetical protein SAMN05421767_1062 [Granulicatella balaenopterae]|uniref:Uncharacterized protein n=1 Tax=Granulicatella balaenopterae TaxID=137733 RepID=A0A1H9IJ09_9LACT|nr:hypothetical protein [Granulicatella balaenopterae]SEQ74538.1 hypothetical protein SAMN05421767_1062 [Granulicatella balaenopterae]